MILKKFSFVKINWIVLPFTKPLVVIRIRGGKLRFNIL